MESKTFGAGKIQKFVSPGLQDCMALKYNSPLSEPAPEDSPSELVEIGDIVTRTFPDGSCIMWNRVGVWFNSKNDKPHGLFGHKLSGLAAKSFEENVPHTIVNARDWLWGLHYFEDDTGYLTFEGGVVFGLTEAQVHILKSVYGHWENRNTSVLGLLPMLLVFETPVVVVTAISTEFAMETVDTVPGE